jgi:CubicO group peptidase (beta-lactamase class C family)
MLLNHTSGIPSYTSQKDFNSVGRQSFSIDSMIGFFKNRPYDFPPGTNWLYNNSGYLLLGAIIEKLSNMSYSQYLRKNIFEKLGMQQSGLDRLDTILPNRARGYERKGKNFINAEFISMEWPFSAGAIYSTIDDLYKWDRALYRESVIRNSSKEKMFTPGMRNYGYGVIIDTLDNHPRIWHNGGIPGFTSNISRFFKDDMCIVVLSNNESNVDFIAIALAEILFDKEVQFPYIHKEVKINPAVLERYTGKYNGGLNFELIVRDGKLYRHRPGFPDIEMKPESETKFFYGDETDRQLEFVVDKNGKVLKTFFYNSGQKGEIKKQE